MNSLIKNAPILLLWSTSQILQSIPFQCIMNLMLEPEAEKLKRNLNI